MGRGDGMGHYIAFGSIPLMHSGRSGRGTVPRKSKGEAMKELNWKNKAGDVVPLRTPHPLEKENKNLKRYIEKLELELSALRKGLKDGKQK